MITPQEAYQNIRTTYEEDIKPAIDTGEHDVAAFALDSLVTNYTSAKLHTVLGNGIKNGYNLLPAAKQLANRLHEDPTSQSVKRARQFFEAVLAQGELPLN